MDFGMDKEGITVSPADFKDGLFVLGHRRGRGPMITGAGRVRCHSRLQIAVFVDASVFEKFLFFFFLLLFWHSYVVEFLIGI